MTTSRPRFAPPGSWTGDPATPQTPVARSAAGVRRLAARADLPELEARTSVCGACPRLVAWREEVAVTRRAHFADEEYWGRPIPGWGDPRPRMVIVGLAPAAHGGNRTGRVFTGDSSGDWLFASLHRVGLARLPTSTHLGDGQELLGARMVATVRCAPPQNKPTLQERDTCAPWLDRELALLAPHVRVLVALGSYGWGACLRVAPSLGCRVPSPRPRFGHGALALLPRAGRPDVALVGSYHPSQHNTFTGRLTESMLDEVLAQAGDLAGLPGADVGT